MDYINFFISDAESFFATDLKKLNWCYYNEALEMFHYTDFAFECGDLFLSLSSLDNCSKLRVLQLAGTHFENNMNLPFDPPTSRSGFTFDLLELDGVFDAFVYLGTFLFVD